MSNPEPLQIEELMARVQSLESLVKKLVDKGGDPDTPPPSPNPPMPPSGGPGSGLSPDIRERLETIETRLTSLEDGAVPAEIVEDLIEIIRMISVSYSTLRDTFQEDSDQSPFLQLFPLYEPFNALVGIYQAAIPAVITAQTQLIEQNFKLVNESAGSSAKLMAQFADAAKELQNEIQRLMEVAGRDVSEDATAAVKKATSEIVAARKLQQKA